MGVTIRKIANDLNLAVSTVSKALRDSHEISPETKARVFEYAAKIDYAPNPYASSLKKRRSGNIAVVVPEVSDTFFSEAINGIEEVAQRMGYHVMIYLTHEDIAQEQSIIHNLRNGRVDGVLISVAAGEGGGSHLEELSVPLVFFDRVREDVLAPRIVTNDFESGYKAVTHLIDHGCTRIAFLAHFGQLAIIRNRQNGYEQALKDNNLDIDRCHVLQFTNNDSENMSAIRQLLVRTPRPDAVVGSVEKVTMQAYAACQELKISIPGDLKVIGFSHLQIASLLNPSLTTITQPAYEMGKASATALFKTLSNKKMEIENEVIEIPSVLVERGSTL
jgi:LacI family transcriptional regulator